MVDLPAPDGDDRTSIKPRRLMCGGGSAGRSLNVLNLFA